MHRQDAGTARGPGPAVRHAGDAEYRVGAEIGQYRGDGLADQHQECSTRAIARQGLPEPPAIGSGPVITTAPMAGSLARFCSWVSPYFPAPSSDAWHGNGGSKECAVPASVPTVSTPKPRIGACSASQRAHSTDTPGVCGPVSLAFRNCSWLPDLTSHPVRYSSQPPSGSDPCSPSHFLM